MSEAATRPIREVAPGRWRIEHPLTVNAKDGSVLVHVPAGEFEMGGDKYDDEKPRHQVKLSGYWIGVYTVTNAQYLKFVQATGHRAPDEAEYGYAVWSGKSFDAEKSEHPVVCVSWEDAAAYAKWAGCELASEAQWERACRGPLGLKYPWGEKWDETKCRDLRNEGREQTSVVYDCAQGASGWGTYNQSGNVWEWCADRCDAKYYASSPKEDPKGPAAGSDRVYRGGSWGSDHPDDFRAACRSGGDPGHRDGYQGFRLVRTAS